MSCWGSMEASFQFKVVCMSYPHDGSKLYLLFCLRIKLSRMTHSHCCLCFCRSEQSSLVWPIKWPIIRLHHRHSVPVGHNTGHRNQRQVHEASCFTLSQTVLIPFDFHPSSVRRTNEKQGAVKVTFLTDSYADCKMCPPCPCHLLLLHSCVCCL